MHRLLIVIFLSLWQSNPKHQTVHPVLLQPCPRRQSCCSNTQLAGMRGCRGSNDAIPAPAIQAHDETTPVAIPFVKFVRLPPRAKLPISNIHRQANAQNKVMCAISAQPTSEYWMAHALFTTYVAHEDLCYHKPICHSKKTGKQDISGSSRPEILLDFLPPKYIYHRDFFEYTNISDEELISNKIADLHYKVIKGGKSTAKSLLSQMLKHSNFSEGHPSDVNINSSIYPLRKDFQLQHGNTDTF